MNTSRFFPVRPSYSLKTFLWLVFNLALISLLLFELTSNLLLPSSPINNSISFLYQNQPGLTDLPTQLQSQNQRDDTNLLPNNNPLLAIPDLPAQACDPDPARVTSTEDDGTCNTLRSAIAAAATTPTKTVTFGLPPDAYLKISPARGGLTLPVGVSIDGGNCSVTTPGYTIVGNGVTGPGLTLNGNNTLRNLSIGGFKGKQIANPSSAHNNQLKCTTTANISLAVPPADPKDNPSALDRTVATTLYESVKFLFLGPDAIQTGVVSGTISPLYVAVLRGKVTNRTGGAIPAVTVRVLNHPEYGKTYSRADGSYDLVVNGGGPLTLSFEKKDYLPLQRQVEVPWQEYKWLPEVALSNLDQSVNSVNLANPAVGMRVVRASPVTDQDGTRRETLLIPQGTTATMKLANGTTQPLTTLNIRASEYTVGTTGPQAMPGTLPPNSGYTQATAFTVDEAQAAGAVRVGFSQPLVSYLENFLSFTVGIEVPAGYYDREKGVWVAGKNGRVVAIVGITNGLADLDTDGNGVADNNSALGITTAERQQLASLYTVGQTLWRTPLDHFTDWDRNWGIFPPLDALIAKLKQLFDKLLDLADPDCHTGSIIECQNQTLGERLELNGTSLSLSYRSDRVSGRKANYILPITLSASSVPTSLKRIELEVYVAGQKFTKTFSNTASLRYDYQWDGKDAYGRVVQGKQPVQVRVGYVYDGVYQQTNAFGYNGNGTRISSGRSRQELVLWQEWKSSLGLFESASQNLGGWSISAHHAYDPNSQTLYLGDGTRHSAVALNANVITTIAGGGPCCNLGDGGPATQATLSYPADVALAPDGSLYIADNSNNRVRRVGLDGIITTVVGTGVAGYSGDGGPATAARLNGIWGLTFGRDGTLYIADYGNHRIRQVAKNGIITTVAGNGSPGYAGDGGLATQASLYQPADMAVGLDGSLYIADFSNCRIRKVSPDGIINTFAGTGSCGYNGDGMPASSASLVPDELAFGADGSMFVADWGNHRIRRIGTDGIIRTVAGNGNSGYSGDGVSATSTSLSNPEGIAVTAEGGFYIADNYNRRLRYVNPTGTITTLAGNGNYGYSGDNGPASAAPVGRLWGVIAAPNNDVYLVDYESGRIRKISPSMPGLSLSDFLVPSEDGSEVYVFNASGRHLSTRHALTGAILLQFGYDSSGRLTTITDADGLVTNIERTNGIATAIVGPYGQRTTLTMNAGGYLASLTNPASETYQLNYTPDGLLVSLTDPRLNSTTFTYDSAGRLVKDQDAAGGYSALSRIEDSTGYTVTLSTALSRTTSYRIQTNSLDQQQRLNTAPTGLQNQALKGTDGSRTNISPSGAASTVVLGPDPRWTMQAPLAQSSVVTAGTGIVANLSTSRSTTITNPNDPLSLSTFSEATTINGRKYTTSYNNTTRTFLDTSPVGRQVTTTIDLKGRVTSEQAANLNGVNYSYDQQGRLSLLTEGSGASARPTSFTYYSSGPANGYLNTITDPSGRTVSFSYDQAGRITSQVLPGSRTVAYGYDSKGNLTSLTPPGRPAHTFSYNSVDLPTSYTMPTVPNGGTNQTSYSYNLDKQLTSITYPDNQSVSLVYDSAGRLKTLTTPTRTLNYTYNATTGQLSSIAGSDGVTLSYSYNGALLTSESYAGPVAGSVSYGYDNNFRLTSQSVNGGNTISYQYDNDNLLLQAGSLGLNRNAQNGLLSSTTLGVVTTGQTYNGFAELTGHTATISGNAYYNVQYSRDNLGRITQKQETIGGVTDTYDYSYDSAGRLYQVKKDNALISSYDYNPNGNRLSLNSTTASYDDQDRLLTYGANSYGYNPRGDLITKTTGISTTTYTYDTESNLLGVALPNGTQISYVVDGQNRRIGKKRNGVLEQGFLYQGQLAPVAELNGANNLVSRFVYATRANVPDYMLKGGQTYRLILDHLGSVRLVVNNATGAIAQRLDYDEFGNILNDTAPGFQPFGFAGGLYDQDTRLTRFGARDYDAETGRWTTKDPIGFGGGDLNLYSYVQNNPTNYIDSSGLLLPLLVPIAVMTVNGLVSGYVTWKLTGSSKEAWITGIVSAGTGGLGTIPKIANFGWKSAVALGIAGQTTTDSIMGRGFQLGNNIIAATTGVVGRIFSGRVGVWLNSIGVKDEINQIMRTFASADLKGLVKYLKWLTFGQNGGCIDGDDFGDPNPSVAFG